MQIFSDMNAGLVPLMVRCECWAFLTWIQDVLLPWSYVSVGRAFLTWFLDVFLPWLDVSTRWTFIAWFIPLSDISVEDDEYLHEG